VVDGAFSTEVELPSGTHSIFVEVGGFLQLAIGVLVS
jgi:hypothetical protein